MASAFFFLKLNGYAIDESLTSDEIVATALKIAEGTMKKCELDEWFRKIIGGS